MSYEPNKFWSERSKWYLGNLNYWEAQDPGRQDELDLMAEAVKRVGAKSVLEVGCGVGKNIAWLKRQHKEAEYMAMDISKEILFQARLGLNGSGETNVNHIKLIRGSAWDLPFKDNSIDFVFTRVCLMHVPGDLIEKAILDLKRVGKIVFCVETIGCFKTDFTIHHDYKSIVEKLGLKGRLIKVRKLWDCFSRVIFEIT